MADQSKPSIARPSGDPPRKLEVTDLRRGSGAEAVRGRRVTMHYVGVAWSSGAEFDSSWDRGEPLTFTLGAREVIKGWDKGLVGMQVGGRRRLVIPPKQAYGRKGSGRSIGPDETLVFVVDLVRVS